MRVNDVIDAAKEAGWEVKQDSKVGKSEEEVGVVKFKKGDAEVSMAVVKARRPEGALRFVRGKKEDDTLSSEGSLDDTAVKLLGKPAVTKLKAKTEKPKAEKPKAAKPAKKETASK